MASLNSQFVSTLPPAAAQGLSVPVGKVQCGSCEKIQRSPPNGRCSRCLSVLPIPKSPVIIAPQPAIEARASIHTQPCFSLNLVMVKLIGQRIREARQSRGMTQADFQIRSRVSRSYMYRTEAGQMTPSIGTLEKISQTLKLPMRYFFSHPDFYSTELLCADPFIEEIRKIVHLLDRKQRAELVIWLRELYRIESGGIEAT